MTEESFSTEDGNEADFEWTEFNGDLGPTESAVETLTFHYDEMTVDRKYWKQPI